MRSSPDKKNKLLLVARTARPLAQMARDAGFMPDVIDLFGDDDTRAAARSLTTLTPNRHFDFDAGQLLGAVAAIQSLRGPMPLLCGSAFERAPALLAKLAHHYQVLACVPQVYRRLLDLPTLFQGVRRKDGIATPDTRWDAPRSTRGWLIKQAGGSGGMHVAAAGEGANASRGRYFQRRVEGASCSALFIANGRHARYYGCAEHLRWHARAGYRYEGARRMAHVPVKMRNSVEHIGTLLTARLQLRGCFGIDFLWRDDGTALLVDINPRPTATLELWPERQRMFAAHIAACTDETLLYSSPQAATRSAHLVLYADAPWHVTAGLRWPAWVADRPPAGSHIVRGAPLCTLLAEASTDAALERQLHERYATLRELLGPESQAMLPATIYIRTM